MKPSLHRRRLLSLRTLAVLVLALQAASCTHKPLTDSLPLSTDQHAAIAAGLAKIRASGLPGYADLGSALAARGQWRYAAADDPYLASAQQNGDTPFAYTLDDPKHPKQPVAIVLAPRFFTDADPTAQAALMVHEMGHWMAYARQGSSTEYDGYKAEFDAHKKLGLTERDGLVYQSMLDGVVENVVPIDKSYAGDPEVAAYIKESSTGEM